MTERSVVSCRSLATPPPAPLPPPLPSPPLRHARPFSNPATAAPRPRQRRSPKAEFCPCRSSPACPGSDGSPAAAVPSPQTPLRTVPLPNGQGLERPSPGHPNASSPLCTHGFFRSAGLQSRLEALTRNFGLWHTLAYVAIQNTSAPIVYSPDPAAHRSLLEARFGIRPLPYFSPTCMSRYTTRGLHERPTPVLRDRPVNGPDRKRACPN